MASAGSSSYFQGGDYVELLSAQGKAPASTWKLQGKITKSFDKAIKGNAFQMDGSSETKMQLPKTPTPSSSSLGLTQRFLVFQLSVPHTRSFSIEIGFSDFQKIRRRLVFASAFRETAMTALHVQIPISSSISRDQWMNFVFDLQALTEHYFPGSSYRSMESICISGSCRLKRIFTTKDAPLCAAVEQELRAHMIAYKQQRLQSKDGSNVPITVAAFAEMKDIPKQFVFSVGTSSLPIPTEYFLATSPVAVGAAQATPAQASRSTGAKATTSDTKGPAMGPTVSKLGATKPKTADSHVSRNRAQMPVKSPTAISAASESRARSAPSARVSEHQREHTNGQHQTRDDQRGLHSAASPQLTSRQTYASPLGGTPAASRTPVRHSRDSVGSDDDEGLKTDMVDQDLADPEERDDEDLSGDPSPANSPVYQAPAAKQVDLRETRGDTSASSTMQRKNQRLNVIAEIQSKLDQLTKEADDEEERDRIMYLQRVSIGVDSSGRSPIAYEGTQPHPMKDEEPAKEWSENELLRSPEPMVLRRAHATKKPEILFSSSIFNFDRDVTASSASDEPVDHGSQRRELFDWDSLLEDSAGSLSKSTARLGKQPDEKVSKPLLQDRDARESATKQVPRVDKKATGIEKATSDESADASLLKMMEKNRLARATTSREKEHEHDYQSGDSFVATHAHQDEVVLAEEVADFDYSTSPVRRNRDLRESVSSDRSTQFDHPVSSPRSESDSDGDLSIDLTDNLGELDPLDSDLQVPEEPAASRPRSIASDDEDSFNFDELVVRDRDFQPTKANHVSAERPQLSTKSVDEPPVVTSARPHSSEQSRSSKAAHNSAPGLSINAKKGVPVPHVSSTASPIKRSKQQESPELGHVSTSANMVSSSHRRLASLLESTDWSQLPLSSVIAKKSPVPTRDSRKTETGPARNKQRTGGPPASSSIELIYDPILRCYFDPIGKKYYTLAK